MRQDAMQAKTTKKTKPQILIFFMGLSLLFGSCTSVRLAPVQEPVAQDAGFFAMGARWSFRAQGIPSNQDFMKLKDKITSFALLYEMTFSDWHDQSELRQIELRGWMSQKEFRISELFVEGLLLSREAHVLTKGAFDITTGALSWNVLKRPVGLSQMKLDPDRQTVAFKQDPKRLSFGGLVKGMVLGEMASFLVERGVGSFWIDAGGGNQVIHEAGVTRFVSRSRIYKTQSKKELHIFSPTGRKPLRESVEVECVSPSGLRSDLIRWGALSDAISTALLLDNSWALPSECRVLL
jgi:hypothetical protein